ncbi:hypothetical protein [Sphingomonas sp. CCH5-D11]|uniref:hypothetical protein n=1 Tax=Sphingomonas sp. CCH5-D11 TaxID=1768786 RepID=UPI000832773F|nr:hypothetical protein [Sphingomonas sp. CCH5-D11]
MKADELRALAGKVAAATGPDRALDAAISAAVRLDAVPEWARMWAGEWRGHDDGTVHMIHDDGSLGPHLKAREWTASLDAAMLLIPKGQDVMLAVMDGVAYAGIGKERSDDDRSAATPALALTAAALLARASLIDSQTETM